MATYYLSDTDITAAVLDTLTETDPAAIDSNSGWVHDKNSSGYSTYYPDTMRPKNTFGGSAPTAFTQYGFRTTNTLTGTFAAGDWTCPYRVINDPTFTSQQGQLGVRIWRSSNADGSGATEISSGWTASGTISFASGSDPQTGTITISSVASTELSAEYLFVEFYWQATASGGNNAAYVYLSINDSTGTRIVTTTFTEPQARIPRQARLTPIL